jgi:hypothetical protein
MRLALWSIIACGLVIAAASGVVTAESAASSPNGLNIPEGFESWHLIGSSSRSDNNTLRVILGNDVARAAADSMQTNPWPDGTILCKLVWNDATLREFPAATVPGPFHHVEFMFKDANVFQSTGGWGFARWIGTDLTPYGKDASFANECFQCHQAVAQNDHVFTRPAQLP